mgnify:CR=1 FL=1
MSPPLLQRLARIAPYFRASRAGFAAAFAAAIVAAATEPLLPALLKRLLDEGFGAQRSFALWVVPVFIVGLYVVVMIGSAIRSEENFLRRRFGTTYDDYRAGRLGHEPRPFSLERAMRNREWRAALGLVVAFALLVLRMRLG